MFANVPETWPRKTIFMSWRLAWDSQWVWSPWSFWQDFQKMDILSKQFLTVCTPSKEATSFCRRLLLMWTGFGSVTECSRALRSLCSCASHPAPMAICCGLRRNGHFLIDAAWDEEEWCNLYQALFSQHMCQTKTKIQIVAHYKWHRKWKPPTTAQRE